MSKPGLLALIVADKVIREDNGKKALIGIFDTFSFSEFPATAPTWYVYASFCNLLGNHRIGFRLVNCGKCGELVFDIKGDVKASEESMNIEVAVPISGLTFEDEGRYELQVIVDDQTIDVSRVIIVQRTYQRGDTIHE